MKRSYESPVPLNLFKSLGLHVMGGKRPVAAHEEGACLSLVTNTPRGPASIRIRSTDGRQFEAEAWGEGAELVIERLPELLGARDVEPSSPFGHPAIDRLAQRHADLRMVRLPAVFDLLVQLILQQRVRWREAVQSYRQLVRAHGTDAPGPVDLRCPPSPEVLARLPSHEFAICGVERKRSDTIRRVAVSWKRVEETMSMSFGDASARLEAFRGLGPWTAQNLLGFGLGDPDAVPLNDAGLPHTVAWALAREARASDARMLELLEPFSGRRWRVIRLIQESGIAAPRFGPRSKPGAAPGRSRRGPT